MSGEIDRKVLHAAMLRIGDCSSLALCALDTVVRIEDDNFDRCTSTSECYYGICEFAWVKVCNSLMGEDLRWVR